MYEIDNLVKNKDFLKIMLKKNLQLELMTTMS